MEVMLLMLMKLCAHKKLKREDELGWVMVGKTAWKPRQGRFLGVVFGK